ncbi:MAG: InlB B-repeat-containing protein [Clostridiales bacterium]|nr:InlB B-repeat-containing protein [Clostridiales bacterium]
MEPLTVTLDVNGGDALDPGTMTVNCGSTYGTLPTPTWTGYRFLGWYLDDTPVTEDTVVTSKTDHTLTAQWGCEHEFSEDGFCTKCGFYQPAELNETEGYYEISNPGQFLWFGALINGDTTYADFTTDDLNHCENADADAVLTADLYMSSYSSYYVPIGYTDFDSEATSFSFVGYGGTFDGQGHTIYNLTISNSVVSDIDTVGIFGTITGTVKNLGVSSFTFDRMANGDDGRFAAIAGLVIKNTSGSIGKVENCYVINSTINGRSRIAGAIAGANLGGQIINSYAYGCSVTADSRRGYLVGDNNNSGLTGTVTNCYADSTLVGSYAGTVSGGEASVSTARFASGEITWKLQNGQSDVSSLIWAQSLTSPEDSYPVLTLTEESKRVLKLDFDLDGSTVSTAYVNNGSVCSSYPESTKNGIEYEFYSDSSLADKIDESTYLYLSSNATENAITVYIKEVPLTYNVTMTLEHAYVTAGNSTTYTFGDTLTLPTADEITCDSGYKFYGWYTDSSFSDGPVTQITSTDYGDKTYYAKIVLSP